MGRKEWIISLRHWSHCSGEAVAVAVAVAVASTLTKFNEFWPFSEPLPTQCRIFY